MSAGLTPTPAALIADNRDSAERFLRIQSVATTSTGADILYEWAEGALLELRKRGEVAPKLRIGEALGLISNPQWAAEVGIPLNRASPRHRVIARLAREDRIEKIWSLNWDAHIENALEQIGFELDEARVPQPWKTAYRTITLHGEAHYLARNDVFCVLKPHGCVRALVKAKGLLAGNIPQATQISDRLLLTREELRRDRLNETDHFFRQKLEVQLREHPLIVIGWSISEPFLLTVVRASVNAEEPAIEECTIIDCTFNGGGHTAVTECYKLDKALAFAELNLTDGPTADDLLLWIQARYALDQLHLFADEAVKASIDALRAELATPQPNNIAVAFADSFLPAWVRLCWRSGLVQAALFNQDAVRLELEDFHVPLSVGSIVRADLQAAGVLLMRLVASESGWDLDRYPGALFDEGEERLVLPFPNWGIPNNLLGLKPLVDAIERNTAFITRLDILPLGGNAPDDDQALAIKEAFSSLTRHPHFSDPANISVVTDLGN
ncbi:MAG: SIR2 family protein [Xanthobacteraceae bacterium]|nr:SIR2 family protein [Xanthobacteraceae bacterium]